MRPPSSRSKVVFIGYYLPFYKLSLATKVMEDVEEMVHTLNGLNPDWYISRTMPTEVIYCKQQLTAHDN